MYYGAARPRPTSIHSFLFIYQTSCSMTLLRSHFLMMDYQEYKKHERKKEEFTTILHLQNMWY